VPYRVSPARIERWQAALRPLAATRRASPLAALLVVAGWFTVDRPWPSLLPWIETHATTKADFDARLGAVSQITPRARHFNAADEPAVTRAATALLAR